MSRKEANGVIDWLIYLNSVIRNTRDEHGSKNATKQYDWWAQRARIHTSLCCISEKNTYAAHLNN